MVQHLPGMHETLDSSFSTKERKIWDECDFPVIYHLTKIFI